MKNILDRFVVGVSQLLQRQGGFYLAFFIFNCLPMCCYMVMKKNEEILSGYTEDNKLVNFKGDISKVGSIVNVKITKAKTYTLEGEEVE